MNQVLIITHVASEGPGSLGAFLQRWGADIRVVRLGDGDHLPEDVGGLYAVVVMGGPMSVNDGARHPFLHDEEVWLAKAVGANIPVLGICLGAQLIAKVCDAPVLKAPAPEVGWGRVTVTGEGRKDILFQELRRDMTVFQWHEDTFDVPAGGILLATGEECRNQAFRCRNAYGLQFHPEVTREYVAEWMTGMPGRDDMLRMFDDIADEYLIQANTLYTNFMRLADIRRKVAVRISPAGGKKEETYVWNRRHYQH